MPNSKSPSQGKQGSIPETGFKMPLPTVVEGEDYAGRTFRENTVLAYISHNGSSFWINHCVTPGSELRLSVDLPKKLAEDKSLRLVIKGTVIFVERLDENNDRHRVSLRFQNQYVIEDGA
jgi:hypothetical protein